MNYEVVLVNTAIAVLWGLGIVGVLFGICCFLGHCIHVGMGVDDLDVEGRR